MAVSHRFTLTLVCSEISTCDQRNCSVASSSLFWEETREHGHYGKKPIISESPPPLRSVHTSNLPGWLDQLGISIFVTTYQAGRLVILRGQGDVLNTHFRLFDKPMGMAVDGDRIAIGAATSVWEFHNLPGVCEKVNREQDESLPPHDACLLPRTTHWTGDIQIHEMAFVGESRELVFANTRFSCLCKRSNTYCFEPVWRPPFVENYQPTDVCHLNGLAVRDGNVRYVTALGETNTPGGWRENKVDGGILMDVTNNEIIARGLSMPHSPRWYRDRLWVLESGTGGFGFVDLTTGQYENIVTLDGFTRGLCFVGDVALIGLSQVRETAVFGGVPIAGRSLEERLCGVWAINLHSGAIEGFVKFEDAVQEIFAVDVFPSRYPELVNEDPNLLAGSFEVPDHVLADVPPEQKSPS